MSNRETSRTALSTAYLRAAHQLLDAKPLIFEDPVALQILGNAAQHRIQESTDQYQTPAGRALRSHLVLRSRFTEDRLAEATVRGVRQYVIVGAGFDTFALRQPEWAASLKIIEIDHLGTQTVKRSRLAETGFEMPSNAAFMDVDFERESLQDSFVRHHMSPDVPTFFSWLGVTMYLTEDAIDNTLRSMAAFPEGSEVVLTFLQHPSSKSAKEVYSRLARHVADIGEPFVSYFEPEEIERKLLQTGFRRIDFLTSEDAYKTYYKQRQPDLPVPDHTGIVCAMR